MSDFPEVRLCPIRLVIAACVILIRCTCEVIQSIAPTIGCQAETLCGLMGQNACASGERPGRNEERRRIMALNGLNDWTGGTPADALGATAMIARAYYAMKSHGLLIGGTGRNDLTLHRGSGRAVMLWVSVGFFDG